METYRQLRRLGVRKEDARFVLPNATATRIIVTMNFRSLRHFFTVRGDKAAQWEIRALALEMLRQVHSVDWPVVGRARLVDASEALQWPANQYPSAET